MSDIGVKRGKAMCNVMGQEPHYVYNFSQNWYLGPKIHKTLKISNFIVAIELKIAATSIMQFPTAPHIAHFKVHPVINEIAYQIRTMKIKSIL